VEAHTPANCELRMANCEGGWEQCTAMSWIPQYSHSAAFTACQPERALHLSGWHTEQVGLADARSRRSTVPGSTATCQ